MVSFLRRALEEHILERTKAEKFRDLANKRVNKTLNDMRLIGNLANRSHYTYSDQQARQILSALQKELDTLKLKFRSGSGSSSDQFNLGE